jgi:hypothetical protein
MDANMIFARFNEDGNLVISSTELVERLAMESFESKRIRGKAKYIIECKTPVSVEELIQKMGNDMVAFRNWEKTNRLLEVSAKFTEDELITLGLK